MIDTLLTMLLVYLIASLPCALAIGAVLRAGRTGRADAEDTHAA